MRPRNTFVLIIANISNPFESLTAKICVAIKVTAANITSASKENSPVTVEIIKNQKENPAVTANAFNLEEECRILDRINKGN